MAPTARAEDAVGEHSLVGSLVLDHLQAEGVRPDLLSEVGAALAGHGGGRLDAEPSELVRLVRAGREACTGGTRVRTGPEPALVSEEPGRRVAGRLSLRDAASVERAGGLRGSLPHASLVAAASLIFAPCVVYSEWYVDELFATVRNPDARGETPFRELLSHDFWGNPLWDGKWTHKSYRPLVILSFVYQYFLNGWNYKPQPLRAFNVGLHSANSLLVFSLLRKYRCRRWWAVFGAFLFAAHPVHAENAVYLVGRADAMATFCWLLALLAWPFAQSTRRGLLATTLRLMLVTLLAIIGGLCKESGFTMLVQLAVVELTGCRPFSRSVPLLAVFVLVFLARSWLTQGPEAGFSYVDTPVQYHDTWLVRTFTYLYFHAKYAQLMVLPQAMSWDYAYNALPLLMATWQDLRFLAVIATYLGVAATASCAFAWRSRRLLIGLGNVLVPFIPASNLFIIVGVTVGERLLYPCNVGWALLAASMGAGCGGMKKDDQRGWLCIRRCARSLLAVSLIALYLYHCGLRVYQWHSQEQLFAADVASYPGSAKANHQYATILHRMGRFDEALMHFQRAHSISKHSALTEYCMAQILIETGRSAEALVHFDSIFKGHGMGFGRWNLYALYVDYGFALMMLQRFEDAVPALQHGLSLNEDVPHGLNALGYSLSHLRRPQEAQRIFELGLQYDPGNPWLMNNLGAVLVSTGQLQQGAAFIREAAEHDPTIFAFLHNVQSVQQLAATGQSGGRQLVLELFYNRIG